MVQRYKVYLCTIKKQIEIMTTKMVKIEKWDNGYYWIIDVETGENIDGDKRKYVVLDMCERWGYIIIK